MTIYGVFNWKIFEESIKIEKAEDEIKQINYILNYVDDSLIYVKSFKESTTNNITGVKKWTLGLF